MPRCKRPTGDKSLAIEVNGNRQNEREKKKNEQPYAARAKI